MTEGAFSFDVFLSFRGKDTRYGFTGNLYKDLCNSGIHTFIDDRELQKGEQITQSLPKAIEESRIAIVVLSKNYASSSFCLDELAKILECINGRDRMVLPVFYDVDPSDVRHQRGSYAEALAEHEERFQDNKEKVQNWRIALHQVANLSGWHFKHGDGYEYKFIDKIIKEVSSKINRTCAALHVADHPIGLSSRVLEVKSLLDVASNDGVHIVGIYGIGGIGKTTLARAVYNLIAHQFEGLCFLDDVRENSDKYGLIHLQEMLLFKTVGEKDIKFGNVNEGIPIIKHRLHRKKVFLILDDVDKVEHLRAMVGRPDWFGPGSRVIITSRDKHLLASHGVERTYEVKVLNKEEALELLSWNAFKTNEVDPSYMDILNRALNYASGLPLALEVTGSNLFGKPIEIWESALDQYKRIPNKEIQKILKVSFDALEEIEQKIFLDIACCFKGYDMRDVEDILCAHYGFSLKYWIEVLVDKSLIKIKYGAVTLHDLIQDMGREIVRQESPDEPGERSRLWFSKDIIQIFKNNSGTGKIQMIVMDFSKREVVDWDGNAFKEMKNLKTLIIRSGHFFNGPIKKCESLTVLNFDACEYISQIPDVSGVPNLEQLSFRHCENLIRIHNSVGLLDKLRKLIAFGCTKLKTFPPIGLTSLEHLDLSYCSSLENFPEVIRKMEYITELELECCLMIEDLPFSIRNLTRLQKLIVFDCGMCQLPSSIVMLPELTDISIIYWEGWLTLKRGEGEEIVSSMVSSSMEHITLIGCVLSDELLSKLPTWFANVKKLDLSDSNFTILPSCIDKCLLLTHLLLNGCVHLQEIRGIPPNMEYFSARNCTSLTSSSRSRLLNQELHENARYKYFCLPGSRMPEWLDHCSNGASISFWFRNRFPGIAICLLVGQVNWHPHSSFFRSSVIINGVSNEQNVLQFNFYRDHILLLVPQLTKFDDDVDEALIKNKWNHVKISFTSFDIPLPEAKEIGIRVLKQESSMEDIRFTDPYEHHYIYDVWQRLINDMSNYC